MGIYFISNHSEWRKDLVEVLDTYSREISDKNRELVKTVFVDGWLKII